MHLEFRTVRLQLGLIITSNLTSPILILTLTRTVNDGKSCTITDKTFLKKTY